MNLLELNRTNLSASIVEDRSAILVDFWAPWCGPCRVMKPILAEVAEDLVGQARVATLNVDDEPEISEAFRIRGIPTLLLIKDGKVLDAVSGVVPREQLVARIRAKLG